MAEKKIVVPEGMLKAAREAHWSQLGKNFYSAEPQSQSAVEAGLEAALRWLDGALEHQRVFAMNDWRKGYDASIDDVRRMFLAREPEAFKYRPLFRGRTISNAEADEIFAELRQAAYGWRPKQWMEKA